MFQRRALTLTETLIYLAMVILLIAIFVPTCRGYRHGAVATEVGGDLGLIQQALDAYYRAHNEYPAEGDYQKTLMEDPAAGEILKSYVYDSTVAEEKKPYCYRTSPGKQFYIAYACDGDVANEAAIDNYGQIIFFQRVSPPDRWISNGSVRQ